VPNDDAGKKQYVLWSIAIFFFKKNSLYIFNFIIFKLKNDTWHGYYENILSKLVFFFFLDFNSLRGQNISLSNLKDHPKKKVVI